MNDYILKEIKLKNFRSHEDYDLDCRKNTTLILGENGCGKTSVLEAIYIAMQGKSFRAVDKEIIKRRTDFYRVELEYSDGLKVVVLYDDSSARKTFLVKDKKTARLPKQYKYPVSLFLPEDLHLLSTSPTKRREYFDRFISQTDNYYYSSLLRYNKALKQRNELLKQEFIDNESLFSWNILLARYGVDLKNRRKKIAKGINDRITDVYRSIAKNKDEILMSYCNHTRDISESEYLKLLEMDFERDKITGHTNFGVHKDDFIFMFNQKEADGNASRGEVRSIVLALKFIEAELIKEITGRKPIVLLDDVFSELDQERRKSLIKNFEDHQVILTSVEGVK